MNVRHVKTVSLPLLFPFCLSFPSCHRLPPNSSSPPTAQISPPVFGVDPDLPWSACSSQHPETRSITGPAATRKHTVGINPGLTETFFCFFFKLRPLCCKWRRAVMLVVCANQVCGSPRPTWGQLNCCFSGVWNRSFFSPWDKWRQCLCSLVGAAGSASVS